MSYEIRLRLIITNYSDATFDQGVIANSIGLGPPNIHWRKGDGISSRVSRRRPNNAIIYEYSCGFDLDPVAEVQRLLNELENRGPAIPALFTEHGGEISIVVRLYDESTPPMHFSRETIMRLTDLHLAVDVDMYVLSGLQPEKAAF